MTIEAMKQWLEALQIGRDYAEAERLHNAQGFKGYEHCAPDDAGAVKQIEDAITSLRQVIAEAEKQEPVAIATGIYGGRFTYVSNKPHVVFPDGTAFYTHPQPKD